ncbi:ABC transporter ATP-binding protein [Rhodoferax saidenbachensis]|uniref:Multiple sugar transport system ATP-binding protein n=1 Tax=Rhodoferax saidenbachensis TaxID=1484693 RepID=A0ABU1ZN90_9BURK|nr:ABC transporter ATP-binding protein [Rhodoferax saidenbachensis]MDR7307024.1 multiple sugar transport system ATP-binding protein [Rhodoferax saidenbachensis]
MASVHIKDLDIVLGGNSILKSMNLEVKEGEFLVLLGPSGCGKSTLLHSIAGFYDVNDGQIIIGGKDVTWADPKDRGIGMVFQSYALYPTMNVERNMSFGLRVAGVPKAEIEKRVNKAADMLQLKELLKRRPSQLSGGQRQRVAIGRALVRDTEVFLFDEPLSNLDAKLRAELRRELKELHQNLSATMIYVTHDQVEAMTLADRIAVMRNGKIQQIDTPAMVYGQPTNVFVAGFLGSPSMNFIKGTLDTSGGRSTVRAGEFALDVTTYPFRAVTQSQDVILGIRPEHIQIAASESSGAIAGKIKLIEPMGAHQILWVDCQGQTLSIHTESATQYQPGTTLGLSVDCSRASIFQGDGEQRI